ncbi:MAG TPA: chemotaxis protein CheD [Elusimicrobia bacterium]|jgi:chemotaxis protein CheD|nr:chemotaxis protein CheD [Elusimicrobiota bacterium]
MAETINVNIGELKVVGNNHILSVTSIGSCVAVILYDEMSKIGGLAHIILPENFLIKGRDSNPRRFADTGIEILLNEVVTAGAQKNHLRAYLVGGASLFPILAEQIQMDIGKKNVEMAKRVLTRERIPIVAEDTGGNYGRTIEFYVSTGEVWIKSVKHGRKKL